MRKIYHHYDKWEDFENGMYRALTQRERESFLDKAILFTGNDELYGSYMMEVLNAWPYSCENNLTDMSINRRAWIGHAACCLAIKCPEDITRQAWKALSEQQRIDANHKADLAIREFECRLLESKHKQIGFDFERKN